VSGFGAVLSNAYGQQMGVPGYRPTTTGEDPQAAAGTPFWQAPGTVGGAMASQHAKTGAVSGVADYVQLGQAAANGGWESVMRNLMQTSAQVASQSQLTSINRERIKKGLPPINPNAMGTKTTGRAAFGVGGIALLALGGLTLWALTRRKKRRRNPRRRRRNPSSTLGSGRALPAPRAKAKRERGIRRIMGEAGGRSRATATRIYNQRVRAAKRRAGTL